MLATKRDVAVCQIVNLIRHDHATIRSRLLANQEVVVTMPYKEVRCPSW